MTVRRAGATPTLGRHWADDGPTALDNLVLLCRPHHRAIRRGFGVQMVDDRPVFTRP